MSMMSESGFTIPKYSEHPSKPGLYLALFHGRNLPNEPMDDWGFDGPLIGPIRWCNTTYIKEVKIQFVCAEDELLYFAKAQHPNQHYLQLVEDLILYDGKFYGECTVYTVSEGEAEAC